MSRFTRLDVIQMPGISTSTTSATNISQPVLKSFYKYMQKKISVFDISFKNPVKENRLFVGTYFNAIGDEHKCNLSIDFPMYTHHYGTHLEKSSFRTTLISIRYGLEDNSAARTSRLKDALSLATDNIQNMSLNISGHHDQVEDYINVILDRKFINLRKLDITGAHFNTYNRRKTSSREESQTITRLQFHGVSKINADALSMLSKDFPNLEFTEFFCCNFDNRSEDRFSQNINIHMIDTAIGTLHLSLDQAPPTVLFSVSSTGGDSKYYISVSVFESTGSTTEEVDKNIFDETSNSLVCGKYAVISVRAKSINRVSVKLFSLSGRYTHHIVEILCP